MVAARAFAIVTLVLCSFIHGAAMALDVMALDVTAFDIEAHRGGRALYPENTLPAFANALTMGVTTLELDIGVTRDGATVTPTASMSRRPALPSFDYRSPR
jgi:glycerophosphoryl diester phosphodiesterase